MGDSASVTASDVSEGDYFSEPGGYQSGYHPEYESKWSGQRPMLWNKNRMFPKSWDGRAEGPEKAAEAWVDDQRYREVSIS
jgi:hypothetical protein